MTRTRDSRSTKKPQGFSIRFNSLPKIIIPHTISLYLKNKFQRPNAYKNPKGSLTKPKSTHNYLEDLTILAKKIILTQLTHVITKRTRGSRPT